MSYSMMPYEIFKRGRVFNVKNKEISIAKCKARCSFVMRTCFEYTGMYITLKVAKFMILK